MKSEKNGSAAFFISLLGAVLSIGISYLLPRLMISSLPRVSTTFARYRSYTPGVLCGGSVEYSGTTELCAQLPLVIKSFEIKENDRIYKGQEIAVIDKEKTAALFGGNLTGEEISALPDVILSPYSGYVLGVSRYDITDRGGVIAVIGETSRLTVRASVYGKAAEGIRTGQKTAVSADDTGVLYGTVTAVRDDGHGTAVYIGFDMPAAQLTCGDKVRCEIMTGSAYDIMTLPYSAVFQDDAGEYVCLFDKGASVRKYITTGAELSDSTEVIGLDGNEEIILSYGGEEINGYVIRDGAPI